VAEVGKIIAELEIVGIDNFKKEIGDSVKAAEKLETTVKDTGNVGTQAINNLAFAGKSLKAQLRESTAQLASLYLEINKLKDSGDKGSASLKALEAQARSVEQQAGRLRDAMSDASQVISGAGSDTRGLDRALRTLTLFGGASEVVSGATAIFGVESSKLQETLVRLNAVMALTNGLQQIQNELTKEDSVVTGILTTVKTAYSRAVAFAAAQTKLFQVALAGLGIGLLISAIAALAANWDKVRKFIGLSTKEQDANNTSVEVSNRLREQQNKLFDAELRLKKALGASDKELLVLQLNKAKAELSEIERTIEKDKNIKAFIATNKERQKIMAQEGTVSEFQQKRLEALAKSYKDNLNVTTSYNIKLTEAKAKVAEFEKQLKDLNNTSNTNIDVTSRMTQELDKAASIGLTLLREQLEELKKAFDAVVDKEVQAGNSLANNPDIEVARFKVKALEQQIRDLEETLNRVGTEVKIETKTISQKDLENSVKDAKEQLRNKAIDSLQLKGKVEIEVDNKILKESLRNGNILGVSRDEYKSELDYRIASAEAFFQKIASISSQVSQLTAQFRNNIAEAEFQKYESLKNKGLISERNYQRQVARIKNEQAKKQRRAELVQAAINVPIAILGAFAQTPGGIIVKSIAASVAGIFAGVQLAAIAKKPIPEFGDGGLFRGDGAVRGSSHAKGGVNASLEGGEYVHNRRAVQHYGMEFMDSVNKLKYPILDISESNRATTDDRIEKAIERSNYKLLKKLADKGTIIENVEELATALSARKYV